MVSFFLVKNGNHKFSLDVVYASTNLIKMRDILNIISSLKIRFNTHWCYIGDYNTIFGAHEHKGSSNPSRITIDDFQN